MSRLPRKTTSDRSPSDTPPTLVAPPTASAAPDPTPGLLAIRDATEAQFAALTAAVLARVVPGDALGRLLAELLVVAAGRLRHAARIEPTDSLPGLDWCRYQSLAERNFRAAARDLRRHLDDLAPEPAPSKTGPGSEPKPEPEPEDPAPPPLPESTPEEIAEASAHWRRHIALVRSQSAEWPILLRLGRQVEDVAAWLHDGHSEETLMRWYPGLTRADIAACRSCDAEGLCGPFDPADGPYPPGLPVLDDLPEPDAPGP